VYCRARYVGSASIVYLNPEDVQFYEEAATLPNPLLRVWLLINHHGELCMWLWCTDPCCFLSTLRYIDFWASFNLSWWCTLISCGQCRVSQRAGVIRQAPPRRGSSAAEHLYFVRQSRSLRPAGRDTACNRTIPYIFQRSGFVTLCCR